MDKSCSLCKLLKSLDSFNVCNKSATGRCSRCRSCESEVKKFKRKHKIGYYADESARPGGNNPICRQNRKTRVIHHYSNGLMKCANCPFADMRALSIDHVNNDGNKHRKQLAKQKKVMYNWLISQGYPPGFQVLCMNCQFIKSFEHNRYGRRREATT